MCLNVLRILIQSVVPKSSYEGRTKSNFNIKRIGEILGDPKITLLIFRFFWLYVTKCLDLHPLAPREEKKWVLKIVGVALFILVWQTITVWGGHFFIFSIERHYFEDY